jgi:RNA polymerase sigma-70 factor (ECF subfamily)
VDDGGRPEAFLYVVATNLCRDHWRRAARERRTVTRLREALPDDVLLDPWLRDLVERLPDKLRSPVLLHYYADLPVAVVARSLNRPEGTVKRQLADARRLLATSIEDNC